MAQNKGCCEILRFKFTPGEKKRRHERGSSSFSEGFLRVLQVLGAVMSGLLVRFSQKFFPPGNDFRGGVVAQHKKT